MAQPFIVQRLRVAREAAGSANFAQEQSASLANFADVYFRAAEFVPDRDMLSDDGLVQESHEQRKSVPGRRHGTLNVTAHLTGAPTPLDGSASAPADPPTFALGRMLDVQLGAYRAGQGSTAAAGSTSSLLNVASGHGSRWAKGAAAGVVIGGRLELVEVGSVATDALTPRFQFSSAPSNGATVYNAHTFGIASDPNETLQFIVESLERANVLWALGCNGNLGFEFPADGLPSVTSQLACADWKRDVEVANPIGGGALARGTLTDARPSPFVDSRLLFGPHASGTPHALRFLRHSALSITLNLTFERVPGVHRVNGVDRWRLIPQRPLITGSVTLVYDGNENHRIARDAETDYYLFVQSGSTPGRTVALSLPRVQIMRVVGPVESGSLIGETVEFQALSPEPGTGTFGASPMLVHLA